MSETKLQTARRLGYQSVEEAEMNRWRNLTPKQREALAAHRKKIEEMVRAEARKKRAHAEDLKRRGMQEIEIPGVLIKRAQLGGHGWIALGAMHLGRPPFKIRGLP